uniref:Protein BUD31 homolog n=1 Tax=Rousettus aegyptiacus TaxID=9407 RepID=A0A7J8EX40_ROUAE|nr:BUD31-like protein [Rousettus aegyptiacus]
MPKVKRSRKAPPDGWELIEPTLDELDQKMREAETEPHEGKRKVESLWPIFRIHHQKTRYIFDLFYKRKAISRELYEYCIKEGYADKNLIAKWKKQGYENLCCLRCIQTRDTNFGTNCICRVPKSKLEVRCNFNVNSSCLHLHEKTKFSPSKTVTEEFLRVGSSSAHTVAAGAALAEALRP